ncbi:MAG: aldo/keto reductase [Candidatus Latescibacterota bacterium]
MATNLSVRDRSGGIDRRRFLAGATAAAVGLSLVGPGAALAEEAAPVAARPVPRRRILGRTGLKVSEISFGGIQIQNDRLLNLAIDRGINLVHTAPGYGNGRSIALFGKVMATRRKEVVLALKQSPIGGIDEQLRILNTDHVDILVPPLQSLDEMNNPELPEAYEKLKEAGKIRFSGYACHSNVAEVMNRSIELGFFDVLLVAYNLANREELNPILARAKKEGNPGFMAMKAAKDLEGGEAHSAAFTTLLENPQVDTLLVGMATFAEVERNAATAGKRMGWLDRMRLHPYSELGLTACSLCGACDRCPQGVAVADLLRCGLYHRRGESELAASTFAALGSAHTLTACDGCGACERACPRNRPVLSELRQVHAALV